MAVPADQRKARDAYSKSLDELERLTKLHKRATAERRLGDAFQLLQRINLESKEMRRLYALAYPQI